jgi:hypothetical protein
LKISKSYSAKYKNPIILNTGDIVTLGEEEKEEKWKGWIRASTQNNEGWIPLQIVNISDDGKTGIISEYYSAKEIDTEEGDIIIVMNKLNGWSWVKKESTGEEGWIPDENIDN